MRSRIRLMFRPFLFAWLLCASGLGGDEAGVPKFPSVPPTESAQAAATFRVQHGFEMQLIAAEPLIADPVDVAYDELGRAFVVEMRDYPYPEAKGEAPTEFIGQVRLLEDRDGDGVFDASHVFADKLSWPTSVACWKGGVFVTAAPDIWYFRDTDGDHRADERRRVYSGFTRDNVQAIVNGLRWGLDGRIYGAASGNGGKVSAVNAPSVPAINVTRHDFRFDPATEKFEAIAGGARFGNAFDDWGNRFVCNIRNPVQHVIAAEHHDARNPLLVAPSPIHDVAEAGDQLPVFRISPPEAWRLFRAQRWSLERHNVPRSELIGAGFWTSSSGVTVYRGSAYPPEFRGQVFVGEVAGNLVHRQAIEPAGVTFRSRRADAHIEFVASTDIWFRPVNFVNAPDGTLHVVDMYRENIEHPWSIPDDIKAKLNLRSGNDRGRIYRLAPPGFHIPPPNQVTLAGRSTDELVAILAHPNAWHRETAQRLLSERQDATAVTSLRRLLRESKTPQGRLHALHALAGQAALSDADVLTALRDPDPHLRRYVVEKAARSVVDRSASKSSDRGAISDHPALRQSLIQLAGDPDATVRFQVAMALGYLDDPAATTALAKIARSDADDPHFRAMVLSSSIGRERELLVSLLRGDSAVARSEGQLEMVRELAFYCSVAAHESDWPELLDQLAELSDAARSEQFAYVAGLGMGLQRQQKTLSVLTAGSSPGAKRLANVLESAQREVRDGALPVSRRLAAAELLRFASAHDALAALETCLSAREPLPLQLAAIRWLKSFAAPEIAAALIARWKTCSAGARQEIVESLLSRPNWAEPLVAALERNEIQASQLTIPQRTRLVGLANESLRARTVALLGPGASTARNEIVKQFRRALSLRPDATRGEHVYRRECFGCHRFGAIGHDVGPNLNTIRHRAGEEILVHLFDPNRDVPPQFINHAVQLRDGRVLTGVIVGESDAAIELQRADNLRDSIVRLEIEELTNTGKSLMPDGLEQKLTQQDVADLIGYLLDFGKGN